MSLFCGQAISSRRSLNRNKMILFIYAKDNIIMALSHKEAINEAQKLILRGYKHTATIDAAVFLQYLSESSDDEIINQIRQLSGNPIEPITK